MPILRDVTIEPMARFKLEEYPDFIEAKDYDIAAEIQLTDGKCGDLNVTQTKWNGPISAESHHVILSLHYATYQVKVEQKSVNSPLGILGADYLARHHTFPQANE